MTLSPQWCLVAGIGLSLLPAVTAHLKGKARALSAKLLQGSIILLGAGLNFRSVIHQGLDGVALTFASLMIVFSLGFILAKLFHLEEKLATLLTMGTAICGGSAIGALAPVIQAESATLTIALSVVFLLNALAIFTFPPLGSYFSLSQSDFGIWAALAIHDTSSVVAASSLYGAEALGIATTVKLTRALWILPVTLVFSILRKGADRKLKFPWFIAGFVLVSLLFTFGPVLTPLIKPLTWVSKQGFAVTLFLIGASFDVKKLKVTGFSPLLFGIVLWILVSALSFLYVWQTS